MTIAATQRTTNRQLPPIELKKTMHHTYKNHLANPHFSDATSMPSIKTPPPTARRMFVKELKRRPVLHPNITIVLDMASKAQLMLYLDPCSGTTIGDVVDYCLYCLKSIEKVPEFEFELANCFDPDTTMHLDDELASVQNICGEYRFVMVPIPVKPKLCYAYRYR